jgi:hypothetical protein
MMPWLRSAGMSRPLEPNERDVLLKMLGEDFEGAVELREQVSGAVVVGGTSRPSGRPRCKSLEREYGWVTDEMPTSFPAPGTVKITS